MPMAIAHRAWTYASLGAVVHLQAAALWTAAEAAPFPQLQQEHVERMVGRTVTARDLAIAMLPTAKGAWCLAD